jgi:UDP-N-acetyl-D-glucosamine dehydrogenase
MPEYWVGKVAAALNEQGKAVKGSRVLVLGVAYKAEIADVRESPALDILALLAARGADVAYHDPYVAAVALPGGELHSIDLSAETLAGADCVVVATNHKAVDWALVAAHAAPLVDTRRAVASAGER